jgi:hypothetical protein
MKDYWSYIICPFSFAIWTLVLYETEYDEVSQQRGSVWLSQMANEKCQMIYDQ